ncbi:MAG: HPr family phosphocarrier protein [Planctomycetaceae bacterium]
MSTNSNVLRQTVTVKIPHGLHLNPCTVLVRLAQKYSASIVICKGEIRADARRLLDLMTLGAGPGVQLELEISGDDAAGALEEFVQLFDGDFSAADAPAPPPSNS